MTPERPDSLEWLLEAIPRILSSDSLHRSIPEALELLRRGTGADALVLFLADGDAPLSERWAPDDPATKSLLRPRLKVEALEAIRRGGSHLSIGEPVVQSGRATRIVLLSQGEAPLGAVAIAWPTELPPDDPVSASWIAASIGLVASTVISEREISKLEIQAERDKRWFKTLDEHLRVLDRERQKFAAVVNQTDTFVFVTDEERIIRWNNRAMAVLLPFQDDASSWVGKPCSELCARLCQDDETLPCDCAIRRALENNEVTHQELRISVQGAPGVLYLTALPIKGLDGKPREAMVLIQDLTGLETLRQSESREQALGESQARQGAMIEAAPDAIVSMDHAGRILEFNPAAERIFGHRSEDVLGRDLADLVIPPDLRDRHRQGLERYMASGDTRMLGHPMRIPALRADGTSFPIELTIARISSTGAPVFTGFIRDLTERKQAEDALRSAQDRLQTLIHESNLVVFALDLDGTFTVSAGKGLSALGRREGEVVGKSVYDVHQNHPEVIAHVERCLAGEEFTAPVELEGVSFETYYRPERNEQGEIVGMFGFASDVTERKRLEAQLRHSQKMEAVGRLAGGVAHDFNNLLTVIQGQSQVLLSKMPPRDPLRLGVEEIQKAGERGVLLTRQLLTFSRKNVVTTETLDAGEVVRDMESLLHRLIGPSVRLVTRIGKWPLHVRADRGQLEQVLANLAVNARDAMPEGGELCIEMSAVDIGNGERGPSVPPGPYVALSVEDQGCGMTPEVQSHLFEPFFTTKEQGKGTGLGLSVVYGIVRQSGGDVVVESAPGRGSTFRVYLPRIGSDPLVEPAAPPAAKAAPSGKGTVLLVEDEDAVRALAREFLTLFGYEVIEAISGEEALGLFEKVKETVDVVVTDLIMPGMGGVDLAKRLVAIQPGLRVLLVSGYARDSLEDLEFKSEGFSFLQKPYTMEDFGRRLEGLIRGASLGDRGRKG